MKITIVEAIALLNLVQGLAPQIKDLFARGEISADEQARLKASVESILADYSSHFSAPHWQVRS